MLGGNNNGTNKLISRGFYTITFPNLGAHLDLDSSYKIMWTKTDTVQPSYVNILLYHGDTAKALVGYGIPDTSFYLWSVWTSRIGSGSNYHLKIINTRDTSRWDVSNDFSTYSNYSGFIVVTSPKAGTSIRIGSPLDIRWTSTGNVGTLVYLQLFKDTLLDGEISGDELNLGAYAWNYVAPYLGPGSNYHICVFSSYEPSIRACSPPLSIIPGYPGSIAINSPKTGDSFEAGIYIGIKWMVTGNPGTYATAYLFKDSAIVVGANINLPTLSTGFLEWEIPKGLLTSDRYRIKIMSTSEPGIADYSGFFSIIGLSPDVYENDDSLRLAKTISTDGSFQSHTLPLSDIDWIQFSATVGKSYFATVVKNSVYAAYFYLYDSLGVQLVSSSGNSILYHATRSGKFYLRVNSWFSSTPGKYSIAVQDLDLTQTSSFSVKFSIPDSATIWVSGSDYSINWRVDSLFYGICIGNKIE